MLWSCIISKIHNLPAHFLLQVLFCLTGMCQFLFLACVINCAGKSICLHVYLHARNSAGLFEKTGKRAQTRQTSIKEKVIDAYGWSVMPANENTFFFLKRYYTHPHLVLICCFFWFVFVFQIRSNCSPQVYEGYETDG